VLAHEPAEAAAQREPGDARVGNGAARRGEAERLGFVIELAPEHAALGPYRAGARVDPDAFHRRQVEDQAAVVGAVARRAVAAAAQGQRQAVGSGEVDGLLHVGGAGRAHDEGWTAVDVAVPHASRRLVAGVIASDQLAAERASETVDVGGSQGDPVSIRGHCCHIGHDVTSSYLECERPLVSTSIPSEMAT
jgi:hypothetical protein